MLEMEMEDGLNGRGPQWKMIKMEEFGNGL